MDGFQGREVDVVLFSCVRAASAGGGGRWGTIGFLSDRRRMNVAITRARRSLIVFGNVQRLASDRTWRALVEHAASLGRLVPGGGENPTGEALCARLEATAEVHPAAATGSSRGETGGMEGNGGNAEGRGGEQDVNDAPRRKKKIILSQEDERSLSSGGRQDGEANTGKKDDVQMKNQTRDSASANGKPGGDVRARDRDSRREARDGNRAEKTKKPSGASNSRLQRGAGEDTTGDDSTKTTASNLRREQRASVIDRDTKSDGKRRGRDTSGGGSDDVERPPKRVRDIRSDNDTSSDKKVPSGSDEGGFNLGGLLGSIKSTAAGIASGREHEFRRGLQGGMVRVLCQE